MEVFDLRTMQKEESAVSPLSVALGNFDGVHTGHAELIREAAKYARENGIRSAVWTFSDESAVLPNKPDVRCITSTKEKLELIAKLGVDFVILENFEDVRNLTPGQFVSDYLKNRLGAVCAVCGFNFRFGAGGVGDAKALESLMYPKHCIVVPPIHIDGITVSSTEIRRIIESGDMELAEKFLGHSFSFTAPVVDGKHLGRTIGIPTINQNFPIGHIIPGGGIYICRVKAEGKSYPGIANIGTRPTIKDDDHTINCETHIIGYSGTLYGEPVKVSFLKRLRDEMKFADVDALGAQIRQDINDTLAYFENIQC